MKRSSFWLGLAAGVMLTLAASQFRPVTLVSAVESPAAAAVQPDEKEASADETKKSSETPHEDHAPLLYELRTYIAPEGKLDALNARFRNHTMKLFEKHGMKNIIYWTPVDKPNTLIYVIAHKDMDSAKASWDAFVNDPEWKKVAEETQRDGKLVEKLERVYLTPTDYSPHK